MCLIPYYEARTPDKDFEMKQPPYFRLFQLVGMIESPNMRSSKRIFKTIEEMFGAPGSASNHQAWPGGYWDHVTEVMNFGILLFDLFASTGRIPCLDSEEQFTKNDVLTVLFIHDLEKPYMYTDSSLRDMDKPERIAFRTNKLNESGYKLSKQQQEALRFVEGVRDADYDRHHRVMSPLATLCHMADLTSARIFHDFPLVAYRDTWQGASRAINSP